MNWKLFLLTIQTSVLTVIGSIGFLLVLPQLPFSLPFTSYTITSGSMEPVIPAGSIVIVGKTQNVSVDDIIAFASPVETQTTIVHRIVKQTQESGRVNYSTKGDNNNAGDNWMVNPEQIIGKVFFTIPFVGYISAQSKHPMGFAIFIGIPLFFFAYKSVLLILEGFGDVSQKRKSRLQILLIGGFGLIVSVISTNTARSLFVAESTIHGISLYAVSLTPTPSIFPSTTPLPTPTPTSSGTVIIISGNGEGSQTTVEVNQESETVIQQSNTVSTTTQINTTSNTGGNTIE